MFVYFRPVELSSSLSMRMSCGPLVAILFTTAVLSMGLSLLFFTLSFACWEGKYKKVFSTVGNVTVLQGACVSDEMVVLPPVNDPVCIFISILCGIVTIAIFTLYRSVVFCCPNVCDSCLDSYSHLDEREVDLGATTHQLPGSPEMTRF